MIQLRRFFIPLFLVGWFLTLGQVNQSFVSSLISGAAADLSQTTNPADDDDSPDTADFATDCVLKNHQPTSQFCALEIPQSAVPEPARMVTLLPVPCLALSRTWQFIRRAALPPRAPAIPA